MLIQNGLPKAMIFCRFDADRTGKPPGLSRFDGRLLALPSGPIDAIGSVLR
jgi:hypothetical protein